MLAGTTIIRSSPDPAKHAQVTRKSREAMGTSGSRALMTLHAGVRDAVGVDAQKALVFRAASSGLSAPHRNDSTQTLLTVWQ
jgi:hypothetical protein